MRTAPESTRREADPERDTVLCIGPPVDLAPHAEAGPPSITFQTFAQDLDLLGDMIDGHEIANCDTSSVAEFIHNRGGPEDRAAGLLALLPIARKVLERIAGKNQDDEQTRLRRTSRHRNHRRGNGK